MCLNLCILNSLQWGIALTAQPTFPQILIIDATELTREVRYGVSFLSTNSDLSSVSVTVVLYTK